MQLIHINMVLGKFPPVHFPPIKLPPDNLPNPNLTLDGGGGLLKQSTNISVLVSVCKNKYKFSYLHWKDFE